MFSSKTKRTTIQAPEPSLRRLQSLQMPSEWGQPDRSGDLLLVKRSPTLPRPSVPSQAVGKPDAVDPHSVVPIASPGSLACVIGVLGVLAVVAWVGWRFGPTLTRVTGWCSWWVA